MDLANINKVGILDDIKDGVIIINNDYKVVYVNESARFILKTEESLVGKLISEVFRISDYYTKEPYQGVIEEVFETKKHLGLKKESAILTFENNLTFVSASISPIIDEAVTGIVIFFKNISKIKQTELELSKFRKAFENSIEFVIITNNNWEIEYCNSKCLRSYENFNKIINKSFWDICGYAIDEEKKKRIFNAVKCDNFWVGEVSKIGEEKKWCNVSIIVLRDIIGNIINYVISESDITLEKESKRLLLNERKNLNSIINGSPVGMMTVTHDFKVLQINQESIGILGVNLKQDNYLEDFVDDNENLVVVINMINQVIETKGALRNHEFHVFRTVGKKLKKRWIKANAVPILLSDEKCVLLSFEDETIKKEMAKTIIRNERQLRLVTDNMQDIITQINTDLIIEYCSNSHRTMLGYEVEYLLSKSISEIIVKEDNEILKRMVLKCKESEDNLKFEMRFVRKDKSILYVEVVMKYIKGEDLNSSFLLFGRDVTQRRISEQEMIASKELAIASNNAKSEFLANMSHEIRTPLNGIIGMANVSLMNETSLQQKENIILIKQSAENLLKIINSVLDFSKIEAGKVQIEENIFDLKSSLKRLFKPFKIQADQKEIIFSSIIDENISDHLSGDETRLLQIMTNLIGNSIKFTDFGNVNVSVDLEKKDEEFEWIKVSVRDTGIGIKDSEKEKVFASFSQADGTITRKYGGTGLGLNITKQLIELMNGSILFNSKYGEGSEFIITLPLRNTYVKMTKEHENNIIESDTIGVGYNILIAEDDKINQKLAIRLLKRKGYGITVVENGQEALDIFEEGKFDLILMDIQMPIMDGLTATNLIRKKSNVHIPIVALTAYAIKGDREKFLNKGMDDYISKPIDLDEFYNVLEKHLNQKSNKKDVSSIDKILAKLDVYTKSSSDNQLEILAMNHEKINMQLKNIASSISKSNYEKMEEKCYAFKSYITSLNLIDLRKLVFTLELHIRKENEDKIRESFQAIISYMKTMPYMELKGVELNENINS